MMVNVLGVGCVMVVGSFNMDFVVWVLWLLLLGEMFVGYVFV